MRKKDALAYFDGNRAALGRAIGITRVTVREWPDVIPHEAARGLEIATRGKLKIDESLYPRIQAAKQFLILKRHTAVHGHG